MIKIRNLSSADVAQVARHARSFSWFSIPSEYIIWMLSSTQKPFCKVLLKDDKLFAYILAVKTTKEGELFIWQLGSDKIKNPSDFKMLTRLCKRFYNECLRKGIRSVRFTVPPNQSEKLIRKLTDILLHNGFQFIKEYPRIPQTDHAFVEREFIIREVKKHE